MGPNGSVRDLDYCLQEDYLFSSVSAVSFVVTLLFSSMFGSLGFLMVVGGFLLVSYLRETSEPSLTSGRL